MTYTLFETIRTHNIGTSYEALSYHMERLERSMQQLGYITPDTTKIPLVLEQMLPFAGDKRVKVCVSKDHWWGEVSDLDRLENARWKKGIQVCDVIFERPDPSYKYETNLYRTMMSQAEKQGFDEVLFVDANGYIREGNISNVFFVKEGVWITPKDDVLEGVQRRILLDQLRAKGISVELRAISKEEAQQSDHIFVTNRIKGVVPVVSWGTKKYPILDVDEVLSDKA